MSNNYSACKLHVIKDAAMILQGCPFSTYKRNNHLGFLLHQYFKSYNLAINGAYISVLYNTHNIQVGTRLCGTCSI